METFVKHGGTLNLPKLYLRPNKSTRSVFASNLEKQHSIPTLLSLQLSLLNTLKNLEFVYSKPDFAYLVFLFPDFSLIIDTTKHSTLKHQNLFCGKRHHSYEMLCFYLVLFINCWGDYETLFPGHFTSVVTSRSVELNERPQLFSTSVHAFTLLFKEFQVCTCF